MEIMTIQYQFKKYIMTVKVNRHVFNSFTIDNKTLRDRIIIKASHVVWTRRPTNYSTHFTTI